ncbi:COQ9 family protein [Brevundimonas sp. S30B]|uniref:COQ9 family protein n=1 Tax=unclassified Brevundimonas TaxID=2622653 RepID=UPI001071CEE1|nr:MULTISPECIES: COQ9 family protein [unclassified Brevundimonas]QBX38301.1 COQ9 family protein [Brevundimonas sp. MF30-B]TFW01562.1 COQ9 family protein [Brevundimonas sp. S30B]
MTHIDPAAATPPDSDAPDWAETTEQAVLDAAVVRAGSVGWSGRLVRAACAANGLSEGDEELLLPNGARDLAALLSRRHDARALEALSQIDAGSLKIRERIASAVSARLEAGARDVDACRRCAGFLALPPNADLGLRLAWETANHLWRWAGDTATDQNHYSKRAILAGILIPAMTMRWFDGREAAEAFVARRIDNVMAFEKWKAGKDFNAPANRLIETFARLRYGARSAGAESTDSAS